jgi:hypothetical protein
MSESSRVLNSSSVVLREISTNIIREISSPTDFFASYTSLLRRDENNINLDRQITNNNLRVKDSNIDDQTFTRHSAINPPTSLLSNVPQKSPPTAKKPYMYSE